jgi:hypothetical protein
MPQSKPSPARSARAFLSTDSSFGNQHQCRKPIAIRGRCCDCHPHAGWTISPVKRRLNKSRSSASEIDFPPCYQMWRSAGVTLATKRSQGLKICLASSP